MLRDNSQYGHFATVVPLVLGVRPKDDGKLEAADCQRGGIYVNELHVTVLQRERRLSCAVSAGCRLTVSPSDDSASSGLPGGEVCDTPGGRHSISLIVRG